jgi:DNA-binding NarL/FixJ family response regulator
MNTGTIRICLVDDQTLVRQGIRSLLALAEGMEVIAEAGDGRQAVDLIPQVRPDVVLMDMRMPVMSGLEALQALARANALPPTIILTTFDDDQLVLAGLKAGAKGYLLKDVTLEQLVGAIQTVAAGGSLVQPAVTQRLLSGLEHMRNRDPAPDGQRLFQQGDRQFVGRGGRDDQEPRLQHPVQARRARPHARGAQGLRTPVGVRRRPGSTVVNQTGV